MAKFLIWAVIILGVMLVARMVSHRNARERSAPPLRAGRATAPDEAQSMVRCEHCQIYLPRSEAFMSQGKTWCSADHARLGLKK